MSKSFSRPTPSLWHEKLKTRFLRHPYRDVFRYNKDTATWNRPVNWLHHFSLIHDMITKDFGLTFSAEHKTSRKRAAKKKPIDFAGLLPDGRVCVVVDDEGSSGNIKRVIRQDEGRNLQDPELSDA